MRTNKITVFFLILVMMITAISFTSCDGDGAASTTGGEGSISSPTEDIAGTTDSQSPQMSEEALQSLESAFERFSQAKNYTVTGTVSETSSSIENGGSENWHEIQNMSAITKIDNDKQETKTTEIIRYTRDGEWETNTSWNFQEYTSETEGISYNWNEELDTWQIDSFSENASNDNASFGGETWEEMCSMLKYDESTGIYSLEEYNADHLAIEYFLGRNIEIESGEATLRYRNIEIELRNGYIYRYCIEIYVKADIVILDPEGTPFTLEAEMTQRQENVFKDYGTTVVTLPVVN